MRNGVKMTTTMRRGIKGRSIRMRKCLKCEGGGQRSRYKPGPPERRGKKNDERVKTKS